MKNRTQIQVYLICLGLLFVSTALAQNTSFKVLKLKGNASLNSENIKIGEEYPLSDLGNLTIKSNDETGFIVVCYNNCSKNKVILERTIKNLGTPEKRQLLETTAFKTRGAELSSFSELVAYFEKKPLLILGDCQLSINKTVLSSPQKGSYFDLYYLNDNEEMIYEAPYIDDVAAFELNMFQTNVSSSQLVGPIAVTFIDPQGHKEKLVTEYCYVATIDPKNIDKYIDEMLANELDKKSVSESITELLQVQYPDYFIDKSFVEQYVEAK